MDYLNQADTWLGSGSRGNMASQRPVRRAEGGPIGLAAGGPIGLAAGGDTGDWRRLWGIVQGSGVGGLSLTSDYRPGGSSAHAFGDAIDVASSDAGMKSLASRIAGHYHNSYELIHNPNGSIKEGKNVPASYWGAATWAAHLNHVHWAGNYPGFNGSPGGGPGILGQIGGFFTQLWQNVLGLVDSGGDAVTGAVSKLGKWVSGGAGALLGLAKQGSKALFDGVWSGGVGPILNEALGGFGNTIPGNFLKYGAAEIKAGVDNLLSAKDSAAQSSAAAR